MTQSRDGCGVFSFSSITKTGGERIIAVVKADESERRRLENLKAGSDVRQCAFEIFGPKFRARIVFKLVTFTGIFL